MPEAERQQYPTVRPVVHPTVVDGDGTRITVVTRLDGSTFKVTVPKGAMKNRQLDPWPRDKYAIKMEEL
jgi:hypothetical protein